MPDEDATLSEFVDAEPAGETADRQEAGDGPASGESADGPGEVRDGDSVDPDGASVDPAEATYRWTGEGARCDGCGAHVERLWRDDGFVCSDCKEW